MLSGPAIGIAVRRGYPGLVGRVPLPRPGGVGGLGVGSATGGGSGGGGGTGDTSGTSSSASFAPALMPAAPPAPGLPPAFGAWALRLVDVVNGMLQGKMNVTMTVTLTANAGSTTIKDARISKFSFLQLMPLTANAATEAGGGSIYISAQVGGQATITHANNSQTDRSFRVVILG